MLLKCWVSGQFNVSAVLSEVGEVGAVVGVAGRRRECWWAPGLDLSVLQQSGLGGWHLGHVAALARIAVRQLPQQVLEPASAQSVQQAKRKKEKKKFC